MAHMHTHTHTRTCTHTFAHTHTHTHTSSLYFFHTRGKNKLFFSYNVGKAIWRVNEAGRRFWRFVRTRRRRRNGRSRRHRRFERRCGRIRCCCCSSWCFCSCPCLHRRRLSVPQDSDLAGARQEASTASRSRNSPDFVNSHQLKDLLIEFFIKRTRLLFR